ncbi:aminoacyl tRNA synthase complex-interacting multifunctional protein 2-like [Plakobranchus ocellatus]|uniref:Aminoacyl tRNA synthase complex-interacting multifunctional protein 2-like n=1 Tax=Plakobranchus ocellatus TaxID=259542 RepID=A0AAV3ZR22_9GAST|nr:aminoacyl tRNA synthase complex-interacting multifunctional protein 2-like [Plakobranchus ocellatus]
MLWNFVCRKLHEVLPNLGEDLTKRVKEQRVPTPAGRCAEKSSTPLGALEQRQEDVLKQLEEMQAAVSQLALRYKIQDTMASSSSTSSSSVTASSSTGGLPRCHGEPGRILDLVISADPSSIPLSLVILSKQLSQQFPTLLSTFVHSSAMLTGVSDQLQQLLTSNGGLSRADCQIAVTLVWKKVCHGPQLVVDPVRQTAILGEANVARYLWGLLAAGGSGLDPAKATIEDELVDQAQLQILEGNNKEKAAVIRRMNSTLGKQQAWLMGGDTPTLADIICWSAMQQAGLAQGAPPNVQRWLAGCRQHRDFMAAQSLVVAQSS